MVNHKVALPKHADTSLATLAAGRCCTSLLGASLPVSWLIVATGALSLLPSISLPHSRTPRSNSVCSIRRRTPLSFSNITHMHAFKHMPAQQHRTCGG